MARANKTKVSIAVTKKSKLNNVKKSRIAKKTFKGNKQNATPKSGKPTRRSTRTPKKVTRFGEVQQLKSASFDDSSTVKSPSKTKKVPVRVEVKEPQLENDKTQTSNVVGKKSKSKKVAKSRNAQKAAKSSEKAAKEQKGAAEKSSKNVSIKKGNKPSKVQSEPTPSSSSAKRTRDAIPQIEPKPAEPKKKRHKNDKLVPRPDIPDMQINSFFYGKTNPKFISVSSYARIAHRFILKKDLNGLKRAIADRARFHSDSLRLTYSESYCLSPECEAVLTEDLKFIDDILKISDDLANDKQGRVVAESVLLREVETGRSNMRMLGYRTRSLQMTRGAREGINALLRHDQVVTDLNHRIKMLIERNISFATLEHITSLASIYETCAQIASHCTSFVVHAVRFGYRKLAGKMIETYSSYNFNDLHIQTLLNDRQPLKKFKQISVLKKGQMNDLITPVHTAAINPNVAYLKALADVEQNWNVPDAKNWYPIHYAAVCEGPGPLKFLLERNVSFVQTNKQKDLALHCAARAGRVENVRVLLDAIQKAQAVGLDDQEASDVDDEQPNGESSQAETEDEEASVNDEDDQRVVAPVQKKPRFVKQPQKDPKKALINAGGCNGMTALHMAAERGHEEVVRLLLSDSSINVEATMHASKNKLTPLMMACRMGFRNIADILIDEGGAVVEKGDKLKRTALAHAVINGQNHIVAMLLRRGASPCTHDSSGNTPAHYAAAYGWFECLEMLAKTDSSCLSIDNDWHLSPLAVAYLKGHIGIVDWLVGGPYSNKVTVNCCNQAGVSLISCVINCYEFISDERIVKQLEYLTSKGADCSLNDTRGNNALHHFASINTKFKIDKAQLDEESRVRGNETRLTKDDYRRCIDLILHAGAGLLDKNENGEDAFHVAIKTCNLYLAECLFNRMVDESLDDESLNEGTCLTQNESKTGNILHLILELPFKILKDTELWTDTTCPAEDQYNIVPLLQKIISLNSNRVIHWLQQKDAKGRTPIVLFCQKYVAATIAKFHKYDERAKQKCQEFFEDFMQKMCGVLEMLASFDGTVLLQTFEDVIGSDKKKSDNSDSDDNEEEEEESDRERRSESIHSDGSKGLGDVERQDGPNEDDTKDDGDMGLSDSETLEPEVKASHMNVISYGLIGNQELQRTALTFQLRNKEYHLKNKLLITMVEVAKKTGILDKLLAQRDADECTPLLYAIMHENLEMCLYLMKQRLAIDADTIKRYYCVKRKRYVPCNKTVLLCALEKKLLEVVIELNLTNDQWNVQDHYGNNPFHFASRIVSPATVRFFVLLKHKGVEIKANALGQYPLHVAVDSVRDGGVDVLTEPLDWLIRNGPGINAPDTYGRLPLHYAFVPIGEKCIDESAKSIDPIAVVSVLEHAMEKDKLDWPDFRGNTPLHYAARRDANVCTVTLLGRGCQLNRMNENGNTPLGIAVLYRNEACTLTLIQAKSDVAIEVTSDNDTKKVKDERWVWIPNRSERQLSMERSNLVSLVVRNGWQAIIYVILDILGKNERTIGELLRSALQYRTYNLAFTLLNTLSQIVNEGSAQVIAEKKVLLGEMKIFEAFAKNLEPTTINENILRVFNELLASGINWYSRSAQGILTSESLEHLARHGPLEILNALKEHLDEHQDPNTNNVQYTNDNENPLVGIVEYWIKSGASENAIKWLRLFADKFGVNTLMLYERPAFDGMFPWQSRRPEARYSRMTPLIRAIQARCVSLVKFLLDNNDLHVDVNQTDEFGLTPLMHSCIVNSEPIVRLLFESGSVQKPLSASSGKTDKPSSSNSAVDTDGSPSLKNRRKLKVSQQTNGIGGLFGSFGTVELSQNTGINSQPLSEFGDVENEDETDDQTAAQNDVIRLLNTKLDVKRTVSKEQLQKAFGSEFDNDGSLTEANFLHFMLTPCAWENAKLLSALCNGTPAISEMLDPSNSEGLESPLMTAKRFCQAKMLTAMKRLCNASKTIKIEMPIVDISNIMVRHDVKADSERFITREAEEKARLNASDEQLAKSIRKPHKNSGFQDIGEICTTKFDGSDEEILYKVLLTKTDVTYGTYGFHNFYRMELIKRKGSQLHLLFTNWGRIGDEGQYQCTPFSSFANGDKEFRSVFRSKTGNDFANIRNFQELPNKYRLVKIDPNTASNICQLKIELDTAQSKKTASADQIYALIRDISNVKRLQERTQTVYRHHSLYVPFGRLSRGDILEARKVLQKLYALLKEMDAARQARKGVDVFRHIARQQADLTNNFYRLIPVAGYETGSLKVIESEDDIGKLDEVIENLLGFEITGRILTAAAEMRSSIDPYLYIMNAVECELTLVDSEDLMSQRILQYIHNSSPSSRVRAIFSVKSKEATQLFNENALRKENHRYLWHGTKPENLIGILRLGLLSTPASALQCGQSFGKGIYFADLFAKSESYCTPSAAGLKYALLCQVALGKVVDNDALQQRGREFIGGRRYRNKPVEKADYDTLKVGGLEFPDPDYDITTENGVSISLGPTKTYDRCDFQKEFGHYTFMQRNEYVVKNKSMTNVKYIIAFQ